MPTYDAITIQRDREDQTACLHIVQLTFPTNFSSRYPPKRCPRGRGLERGLPSSVRASSNQGVLCKDAFDKGAFDKGALDKDALE